MKELEKIMNENKSFESIKHIDEKGNEYWLARELQIILEYNKWENFQKTIEKAILSIETEGGNKSDWLLEVRKPIKTGKGKEQLITDYKLSRYICYIIVLNGDVRKKVIAVAQKYFAIKTRKQELLEEEYINLSEEERRFYKRDKTKKANYFLQQTAKSAGVKNFDKFHNEGYKGLYNGETANDIAKRKGLRYREDILDNMSSEELAANEFRITQAEAKLKRESIQGEKDANAAHNEVGKKVRKAIESMGGTMPEELPTPAKSLKQLEKENKKVCLKTNKPHSNH